MLSLKQQRSQHNSLVAASVEQLPEQIIWTLDHWPRKRLLARKKYNSVIVCGMGGSALAADLLRYIYWRQLKVPVIIVNNYQLPGLASADSLVIIASYSGATEEALGCFQEARKRRLSALVITSGGQLAEAAAADKIPHFIFTTKFNPSGQPRLGLGYMLAAFALSLKSAGILQLDLAELRRAAMTMRGGRGLLTAPARQMLNKNCLIIASEHLTGAAHIMSNQLNETAKLFAAYFALPELNHHLLEGLSNLGSQSKKWVAVMLESSDYYVRTKKRYRLTEKILQRLGIKVLKQSFIGNGLEQGLKMLWWSSALTLKLAGKEQLDATAIPWVDLLKQELGDK
ncbi:MAG: SIS domain-containing protein [Candidatus Komeilibacteria bacterium]